MQPRVAIAIAADYDGRWAAQVVKDANAVAAGVGNASRKVVQSTQAANMNVSNLAAQFNDIGVTLASGSSPLLVALQQGTQIGQVLGPMGAGGAVKALGSAFLSLLSPVNLLTIGAIALGGAVVQWLFSLQQEAPKAEDKLKAHREWLSSILVGYKEAEDAAGAYLAKVSKMPAAAVASNLAAGQIQATRDYEAALRTLKETRDSYLEDKTKIFWETPDAIKQADALAQVQDQLDLTNPKLDELIGNLTEIRNDAVNDKIRSIADGLLATAQAAQTAAAQVGSVGVALAQLSFPELPKGYSDALSRLDQLATPAMTERDKARAALNEGLAGAQDSVTRLAIEKKYQAALAQIAAEEAAAKAKSAGKGQKSSDPLDLMADSITRTETAAEKLAKTVSGSLATSVTGLFSTLRRGGDAVSYLADQFGSLADTLLNNTLQSLFGGIFGNALGGFAGGFGGGWGNNPMAGSNLLNAGSFAGGGYTGRGSRSGGLDGKGGFMAMLHPDETVIDHTVAGRQSGGAVVNNFYIDAKGAEIGVEAKIVRAIKTMVPGMIKTDAPAAVAAAQRNGGL